MPENLLETRPTSGKTKKILKKIIYRKASKGRKTK